MHVQTFDIEGPRLVTPQRHEDERGFFSETYSEANAVQHGIPDRFVQDNHSLSRLRGVLRGLHFQWPPYAQAKLVRCVKGKILDVAVDIRIGSPWFGKHIAVELSRENWAQLYIPVGFAHGFVTLTPDAEVIYKVSAPYSPDSEGGILWSDSALGIDWGIDAGDVLLSHRDLALPPLEDIRSPFTYPEAPR